MCNKRDVTDWVGYGEDMSEEQLTPLPRRQPKPPVHRMKARPVQAVQQ